MAWVRHLQDEFLEDLTVQETLSFQHSALDTDSCRASFPNAEGLGTV
jgi:hypothetical protein